MAAQDQGGSHVADAVQFLGEDCPVDLVEPGGVHGRPEDLTLAQLLIGEVGRVLGRCLEEGPEAVGAEQCPRLVVVKAGGGRVVEHRWFDRGEGAVAHGDPLPWVDEVEPVHRQRGGQAHDAHAEEGGQDPELRVLGQQLGQGTDVVEVGVGEPDPPQVGWVDDRPQRGHELLALDDRSGVDQDGLGTMEDERVDRNNSISGDGEGRRQHIDAWSGLVGRDHGSCLLPMQRAVAGGSGCSFLLLSGSWQRSSASWPTAGSLATPSPEHGKNRRPGAHRPNYSGDTHLERPVLHWWVPEPEGEAMRAELVGREAELAVLTDSLAAVLDGLPRVVVCEGEAGIGKTRLAQELLEVAERRGVLWVWGSAAETSGAPPFWPWCQVLRTLAGRVDLQALADQHRLNAELARVAP